MFCPGCGANNSIEQKFCRACGLNLELSARSLKEQAPDIERADLQRQERALEKFGAVAFTGFGVVVALGFCALIFMILKNMVFGGVNPLLGILLSAFFVFAALTLGYVFWRESLKSKREKLEMAPGRMKEISQPANRKLIEEKDFHAVPSVIEDTTELLKLERKTKHLN